MQTEKPPPSETQLLSIGKAFFMWLKYLSGQCSTYCYQICLVTDKEKRLGISPEVNTRHEILYTCIFNIYRLFGDVTYKLAVPEYYHA